MDWIESKCGRLKSPDFADEFVDILAVKCLRSPGEVVRGNEVVEVSSQLTVAVVAVALDRGPL